MPTAADILWFTQNFQTDIQTAIAGTAFDVDFIVAIACQKTGDVWPILRKKPNIGTTSKEKPRHCSKYAAR